jgi:hypothetical protein
MNLYEVKKKSEIFLYVTLCLLANRTDVSKDIIILEQMA